MKAIYLHENKQATIQRGHPWVFPKAILRQSDRIQSGELVHVLTAKGEAIGSGVYNEHSLYRVRMLAYAFEAVETNFAAIICKRLREARQLRTLLNLPNAETNAYRLVNSEGDGLSGLTIDCFGKVYVISSSARWVEEQKALICELLPQITAVEALIWLPQLRALQQDGWENREDYGNEAQSVQIQECGVTFEVSFQQMQKTGLFLDQRENHARIAQLAKGRRVLDLYTYTGGFALHAAKAGALAVTAVDSSAAAIQKAQRNADLNQLASINFIEGDARDYLKTAGDYEIVILDPPKLIPSRKHLNQAKNYYRFLHREIFKHMRAGSLLLTCNCSSAMTAEEFSSLVSTQALAVNRTVRGLGVFGPASCHPALASFPEGNYLTALLVGVM